MKTITIIGGGVTGLALGIALRHRGVPVTLYENHCYPHHRVCGELICGVQSETLKRLGVLHHLVDAEQCSSTGWYFREKLAYQNNLTIAAFGISRYLLDFRLSRNFRKVGGHLKPDAYFQSSDTRNHGQVWASGRKADSNSSWLGIKMHCKNLPLTHDLEFHFGDHGYVGLNRIEDQLVNVCGVFLKRPELENGQNSLLAYKAKCGLNQLTKRMLQSNPDPASIAQIDHLSFYSNRSKQNRLTLGDRYCSAPAFTANGISMAFESAEIAVDPLVYYAKGAISWEEAQISIESGLAKRFTKRLRYARYLHPFVLRPKWQQLLVKAVQTGLLQFHSVVRATR